MRALSARARDHLAAWDGTAVTPRDAATVVVTRERGDGLEVLLLRRQKSMAFAAGMHVFPGGSVQAADRDPIPWVGPAAEQWARRWSCDAELAHALVVAAVRETFEETGILMAGPDADSVLGVCAGEEWTAARRELEAGDLTLARFLDSRGLVLRADLLGAWAHWITPEFEPRRFDTRFFVAVLPDDGTLHSHGTEADASYWVDIDTAAQAGGRGELAMMAPTLHNLRELAAAGRAGVSNVLSGSAERCIPVVQPRVVDVDGELWMTSIEDSVRP